MKSPDGAIGKTHPPDANAQSLELVKKPSPTSGNLMGGNFVCLKVKYIYD